MEAKNNPTLNTINDAQKAKIKDDVLNNSFLSLTEEELKELNFTPEELQILEDAGAYAQTIDMFPEDFDAFQNQLDSTFSQEDDPEVTLQKLADLCQTDPDFVNQMLAIQEVFSSAKYYPDEEDSETEK